MFRGVKNLDCKHASMSQCIRPGTGELRVLISNHVVASLAEGSRGLRMRHARRRLPPSRPSAVYYANCQMGPLRLDNSSGLAPPGPALVTKLMGRVNVAEMEPVGNLTSRILQPSHNADGGEGSRRSKPASTLEAVVAVTNEP